MGHKTSVLKVTSRISVTGGCGTVDAIRLSYGRRSCCLPKRRVVASFTFPREKWVQLSPQDMLQNNSAEVAKVNIGKLGKKDGNTPVRVSCLAGGVSVFRGEMSLADLLARLKCTEGGGKAALFFSLAGRRLEGTGVEGHAFPVMFCNGMRLDNGGTRHPLVSPQKQHKNEPDKVPMNSHGPQMIPLSQDCAEKEPVMEAVMAEKNPSVEVECETEKDVMGEEDPSLDEEWETEEEVVMDGECAQENGQVMGEEDPSLDVGWETEEEEVMGEEGPSLSLERVEQKEQKVRHRGKRSTKPSAAHTKNDNVPRGEGPLRAMLWDRVADCAGVVALGLILYHAWVEYSTHW